MAASSNPLQAWRERATFDVEALQNFVFTEEIVKFKKEIWDTLAKDPLFAEPNKELALHEKRELSFKRLKRLVEYEFLTDEEILTCPLKTPALTTALLPFDTSTVISWQLNNEVGNLVTVSPLLIRTLTNPNTHTNDAHDYFEINFTAHTPSKYAFTYPKLSTVEPVYNGHPRAHKKWLL